MTTPSEPIEAIYDVQPATHHLEAFISALEGCMHLLDPSVSLDRTERAHVACLLRLLIEGLKRILDDLMTERQALHQSLREARGLPPIPTEVQARADAVRRRRHV